jgi:site-specific recombinase XerC
MRPVERNAFLRLPVKLRLAAIRHLFDWLVNGQIVPVNPAASVRGPSHIVRKGQTPMLEPAEARKLLDSIDTASTIGLRDRALIALMVYSFARVGAAIALRVEDVVAAMRAQAALTDASGNTIELTLEMVQRIIDAGEGEEKEQERRRA